MLSVKRENQHYVFEGVSRRDPQLYADVSSIPYIQYDRDKKRWLLHQRYAKAVRAVVLRHQPKVLNLEQNPDDEPRREYQEQGLWFALEHPSVLLDMYMGTGKTRLSIELINLYKARRVLVVSPLSAHGVWESQFERWALYGYEILTLRRQDSVRSRTDKLIRFLSLDTDKVQVVCTNYESVWRTTLGAAVRDYAWDMVICDECHKLKTPSTKVSRFMGQISPYVPYRLGLSGTPITKDIRDAYGIYRFLQSSIFGRNHKTYCERYTVVDPFTFQISQYLNMGEWREKYNLIRWHVPREALKLDAPICTPLYVPLTDKAWATYREFEKEFYVEVFNGLSLEAPNVLVKYLRLQQMESGILQIDNEMYEVKGGDGKRRVLKDFLETFPPGEPLVVFTRFQQEVDQIVDVVRDARRRCWRLTGSHKELEQWEQDQSGSVLVVNTQTGGESIDLTKAAYAVFYTVPVALNAYEQAITRVGRPGQRQAPLIYLLLPEGPNGESTVGRRVYEAHQARRQLLDYLIDTRVEEALA